MFCIHCGREIKDSLNFCPYCGKPTKKDASTSQENDISYIQNAQSSITGDDAQNTSSDKHGDDSNKRRSGLVVALIILILLLSAAVGFIVYAINNMETEDTTKGGKERLKESLSQDVTVSGGNAADSDIVAAEDSSEASESVSDSTSSADPSSDRDVQTLSDGDESDDEEAEPAEYIEDTGIHSYDIIVADVTWREAFNDCIERGGYLVHFNSEEEYDYILDLLDSEDYRRVTFYIGGTREIDSDEYFWINRDGEYFGNPLNGSDYSEYWLDGEPSMDSDEGEEFFMDMFYRESADRWYWNDVPNDVIGLSDYYKGRMGYICEYE